MHGLAHLLSVSVLRLFFRWDPLAMGWSRPGLPLLGDLAGPIQHFKTAILAAWRKTIFCKIITVLTRYRPIVL